ncbi:hypothetical protein C8F01DRAFT_1067523 [Mycena amicta]|nr:hypothetical protein C8F01DRAFT_1067523 [Mycena amicta]
MNGDSMLSEDLPPAYTAGPDVRQGEATLEVGPARPFQQAPRIQIQRPAQTQYAPPPTSPSLWEQITGPILSNLQSAAFPGHDPQYRYQPLPSNPPPSSPSVRTPAPQLSEFARDFYATTNVPPNAFSDVSGARASSAPPATYPPPPLPRRPSSESYQPPSSRPPNTIPDDGRPTTTPVAGHPLLLNGKMLVYPAGHECHKCVCKNTGYRHSDPSHPCRRCWDKYAKPYAGALLVAPALSPGGSSGEFFVFAATPTARPSNDLYTVYTLLARGLSAPIFTRHPHRRHPLTCHHPSSSYAPPSHPPPQHPSFSTTSLSSSSSLGQYPGSRQPMPTSTLPPGDPRLGGALCWRCSGRGRVSFLVFETLPCSACGGVGRVYG